MAGLFRFILPLKIVVAQSQLGDLSMDLSSPSDGDFSSTRIVTSPAKTAVDPIKHHRDRVKMSGNTGFTKLIQRLQGPSWIVMDHPIIWHSPAPTSCKLCLTMKHMPSIYHPSYLLVLNIAMEQLIRSSKWAMCDGSGFVKGKTHFLKNPGESAFTTIYPLLAHY